jgi:hypothetical protein
MYENVDDVGTVRSKNAKHFVRDTDRWFGDRQRVAN